MSKWTVLYSDNSYFLQQFQFLLSEDPRTFSVSAYTEEKQVLKFLEQEQDRIACILAPENFLQTYGQRYPCVQVALGECTLLNTPEKKKYALNIYQRKQDAMNELRRIYQMAGLINTTAPNQGETKIMAFYSTQGGSGVSTLAYLTAIAAKKQGKRVAYFNLEYVPSTAVLYKNRPALSGEEFFFSVKERVAPEQLIGMSVAQSEHGVTILPTVNSARDREELTREDVKFITEAVTRQESLDTLIIDLSGGVPDEVTEGVLEYCNRVVLVFSDTVGGREKFKKTFEDPAKNKMSWVGKELFVANCSTKRELPEHFQVVMPHSAHVASGDDLELVLQRNAALEEGCRQILE